MERAKQEKAAGEKRGGDIPMVGISASMTRRHEFAKLCAAVSGEDDDNGDVARERTRDHSSKAQSARVASRLLLS
jgi:hypothetical protein